MITEIRYYRSPEAFKRACRTLNIKPSSVAFEGGETTGATGFLKGQTVKVILILDEMAWSEAPNYQKF